MATLQQDVETCERLAEDNPDVYLHPLGYALDELAMALGREGRREEAMVAARRAVEVYRRLAEDVEDVYGSTYARSLIVLGRLQIEDARFVEAVPCLVEAVSVTERLAEGDQRLIGEAAELLRLAYERDPDGVRSEIQRVTGQDVVEWLDSKTAG